MQRLEDEVLKRPVRRLVTPADVMTMIRPGMRTLPGSWISEPRTLVKHLIKAETPNTVELKLIQLFSFGDAAQSPARNSTCILPLHPSI